MGSMIGQSSLVWALAAVAGVLLVWFSGAVRYIPNTRVAVVEKLWSAHGSLRSGFIALRGEAGFQPQVLRGGWHLFFPFQYRVHRVPLVTIPQGKIGYIFARDGVPLPATQALASNAEANDFTTVSGFLASNGQRGPQRQILREGTYAINLVQFVVITEDGLDYLPLAKDEDRIFRRMAEIIAARDGFRPVIITDDLVGIVTVHDGPALPQGEIIAPTVGDEPDRRELPQQLPGPGAFPRGGRQARAPAAGAGRGHLLHQPAVRDRRARSRRPSSRSATSAWSSPTPAISARISPAQSYRHGELVSRRQARRLAASRCCPASTPSTPTPAR